MRRRFADEAFSVHSSPLTASEIEADEGHIFARPTPKRPWHCPHCPARLAYSHTLDAHLRREHAALLPARSSPRSAGPAKCRWCSNGYGTQPEVDLHEQTAHRKNLALDIAGYS